MSKRNQLSEQLENLFSDLATPEPRGTQPTAKEPIEEGLLGALGPTAPFDVPPSEPRHDDAEMAATQGAETYAPDDDVLSSFPVIPSTTPPPPDPVGPPPVEQDASFQGVADGWTGFKAEEKSAARQDELKPAISRCWSAPLGVHTSAKTAVDLIRNRYSFCHVTIYVLDEAGEQAVIAASSSDERIQIADVAERVMVGDDTIVGWALVHRQPRLASDVGRNAENPGSSLLPGTGSELAIPIGVRDELLGVLTVHSAEADALDDDTLQSLQGMADMIGVSLLNARHLAEAQYAARQAKIAVRVIDRIQRATNIDDLLAKTLEELARAYDLAQATVCLSTTSVSESAANAPGPVQPPTQEISELDVKGQRTRRNADVSFSHFLD